MDVVIAAPAWRAYEAPYISALMELLEHPGFARLPLVGDAAIDRARSRGATIFLEQTTADVLLWIDSDISFRAEDAITLCQQAMTHSVVAGIYVTRSSRNPILTSRLAFDQRVEFGTDPTPVPILWAAGGFTAVHRRVYEELATDPAMRMLNQNDAVMRQYPFYLPMPHLEDDEYPTYLSEDWAFAERARQVGYPSFCNPAIRLKHWGTYGFTLEDIYAKHPEAAPMAMTRTSEGMRVEHP